MVLSFIYLNGNNKSTNYNFIILLNIVFIKLNNIVFCIEFIINVIDKHMVKL
jgi:hypothetical protein